MTEKTTKMNKIIEALESPKVDSFLKYHFLCKKNCEGEEENEVGIIVRVSTNEVILEGSLSKGKEHHLLLVPYSKLPTIVGDSNVIKVDWCPDEILNLVRSPNSDEIVVRTPWDGPKKDEWDSPAYNSFWGPVERNFQNKIDTLEKIGKRVKII